VAPTAIWKGNGRQNQPPLGVAILLWSFEKVEVKRNTSGSQNILWLQLEKVEVKRNRSGSQNI
jgi:hypothetical protein